MPCFEARNVSIADVPASRSAIWEVLRSPELLAQMTPLIDAISVDGDRWCWKLGGISGLGVEVAPSFTERMTFTPETEIRFEHDPTPDTERAGANGVYTLADNPDGSTHLEIDITLHVELPLPKMSARAVERVMRTSMERTGDAFARRLYTHLGLDPRSAKQQTVHTS